MGNTPNIRFKGFTDDWEQRKLGATNTFFTDGNYGEAYPKSSDMTDSGSGIPFLTGGNLKDGKLSLDGASYITPEKHSKLTSGHLLEDDIVIAVRGSLGALGYVNTDNSGWNINSQLAILRTDKSELYGKFLIQYLLSWTGQNELLKRQTGSALKQLPIGAIKDVEVPITSIAEQGKIGEYFADLDNLITLHQRKCDETKELKKFMLQKMFPKNGEKKPEIRFEGFTDDWEQRKLLEFGQATGGTSIESEFSEDGIYKVISIGSYSEDSVYRDQGIRAVRSDKTANRILNKGDITMILNDKTASGNIIGRVLLIEESGVYVYNQRTERIEVDSSNYDSQFIYTMLNAPEIRDKIIKQSQGNTQIYVNWTTVSQTDYLVPQLSEQRRIGEYFSNLDNLITLHQRKCDEIKEIKKFMLQNMFPQKG